VTYKPETSLSIHGPQNIIRKMSSRMMRWEVYAAKQGCVQGFGKKTKERENWKDIDMTGRITIKLILEK
jgi:hypothetical protein